MYKRQLQQHQRQRLIQNEWASPEGQVYPIWEICDVDLGATPCIVGVDYGESGVSAAVYLQRYEGNWVATAEYYHDGHRQGKRDGVQHAQAIKQHAPGPITKALIDPSARDLRHALRRAGVNAINAYNKADGYDITNGGLQSGALRINSNRCSALVTEIEDLVYDQRMNKPDLNCADHATDCLRYAYCDVAPMRKATKNF